MLVAYCRYAATYIPARTNRYIDGSVSVVHSAVCDSSKHQYVLLKCGSGFAQVWCMCLQQHSYVKLTYCKGSSPGGLQQSINGRGSMQAGKWLNFVHLCTCETKVRLPSNSRHQNMITKCGRGSWRMYASIVAPPITIHVTSDPIQDNCVKQDDPDKGLTRIWFQCWSIEYLQV